LCLLPVGNVLVAHAQVWKERLFPLLKDHLAHEVDSVTSYQLLYHEAALANLLEVCTDRGCQNALEFGNVGLAWLAGRG
jgi:hypothetical protein